MFSDVLDLRDFYRTSLGRLAARMLHHKIRILWPDVRGQRVVGVGYALPYLEGLKGEAERTLALMPAGQGVVHWPADQANLTALTDEAHLPLPDVSVDRLLLVHCLESTHETRAVLRACWQALTDGGRLLIVVPNRRGLWARSDSTPFGRGTPYSGRQLSALLKENMFAPTNLERALFLPPTRSRFVLSTARLWQKVGQALFPKFSGVILMEAQKQLYTGTAVRAEPGLVRSLKPAQPVQSK